MDIVILGIDLGKNSCSAVGLDECGRVVARRRLRRDMVSLMSASG
jgi:transposase